MSLIDTIENMCENNLIAPAIGDKRFADTVKSKSCIQNAILNFLLRNFNRSLQ